jgi:hypothetical protein
MPTNDNVLDHLEHTASGRRDGQQLVYNATKGCFEVLPETGARANPDTIVAPYERLGFFMK